MWNRREFLEFMGRTSVVALSPWLNACQSLTRSQQSAAAVAPFALAPAHSDQFQVAKAVRAQLLIREAQSINPRGDSFGAHNDFIAFLPDSTDSGWLWVNHEYLNPMFVHSPEQLRKMTQARYQTEASMVGGSALRIRRLKQQQSWQVEHSPQNFRLSGLTPIPFTGIPSNTPQALKATWQATQALGTLGNCAGGVTPWGSILTCEENYQKFYGEWEYSSTAPRKPAQSLPKLKLNTQVSQFHWEQAVPAADPHHYGWVVEVDLATQRAHKLMGLGRFSHEGACVVKTASGRCAVYMGDDADQQFLYKFIAERPGSLIEGTLYVANTQKGEWLKLDWEAQPLLQQHFSSQLEVLLRTREAAALLGATPLHRPEDVKHDVRTGALFVALTNSKQAGDAYGSILKITENDNDYLGTRFSAEEFLVGGPSLGFACPDNLAFDHFGNLWFTTDMSGSKMNRGDYAGLGNNALFVVPSVGPWAGMPQRIAIAPYDAELTGPCFTPDGGTLFLCVQHPGEMSPSREQLTSNWPNTSRTALPQSAVVALDLTAFWPLV